MLYIFKVYIFLMKNFQEFLDDLICLLKENKVFLLSVERFAGVLRRFALFLGWTVGVFAFRDPCFLYEWKKVDWGKKFIYREKRYDWHICCQKKKKKWKNLFQSKKIARRVVYKWQESVNSANTLQCVCKSPMTLHEDRSTHGKYKYSKVFWRWKSLGTAIRDRSL